MYIILSQYLVYRHSSYFFGGESPPGAEYFFDKYNEYEKLLAVVGELVKAKNAGSAQAVRSFHDLYMAEMRPQRYPPVSLEFVLAGGARAAV